MLNYSFNKRWGATKKLINLRLSKNQKAKKLTKDEKFCSFLKNTLIPRKFSYKFDFLINNSKQGYFKKGVQKVVLTSENRYVIRIILQAYIMLWLALYRIYTIHLTMTVNDSFVFEYSTFNFLNKNYFTEIYFANNDLQDFNIANYFDKFYFNTYINYFNLYLFPNLKIFDVLLNFEKFKYEQDIILLGVEKAVKWSMDFFTEDLLNFQDNLLFILCVYEFYLDFNDYLFNIFNNDFFSKTLTTFVVSDSGNKDLQPYNFLTSTYFSFCNEFLELGTVNLNKSLYKNYKIWNEGIEQKGFFDSSRHLIDVKYFGIKMPYVFFLLHTWYSIYYRRARYNYYIRGQQFFQEYAGRMHYFIWHNNPFSKNKAKMFILKYQKLFTIYHFKGYLEISWFNDWFFLYSTKRAKMINSFDLKNSETEKSSFNFLLNKADIFLQNLNFKDYYNKYFDIFSYDNLLNYLANLEFLYGYRLLMATPLVKFKPNFPFGRLSYIEYKPMLETIYALNSDKVKLLSYIKRKLNSSFFFNLYNKIYINFYFLKDFFNLYEKKSLIRNFKILSFYDKIVSIIFMNLDPFFFKYFWKRCFPVKWGKLWSIWEYIWTYLVLIIEEYPIITFDIPKFDFSMYFLNWRIDVSESVITNNFYSNYFNYTYIMINELYKNRFCDLIRKVNFLLIDKKQNLFAYQLFLSNYKNYFFELLLDNLDYILLLYLNNKSSYLNLLITLDFSYNKNFVYSSFIYRYYVYNILFSKFLYNDWFENWDKRILWIYKDFKKHEGSNFYSKKNEVF